LSELILSSELLLALGFTTLKLVFVINGASKNVSQGSQVVKLEFYPSNPGLTPARVKKHAKKLSKNQPVCL